MKMIPGETVALYLTLHGMAMTVEQIKTNALLRYILLWSVVGVVLVFNIPYMRQIQKVEDTKQLVVLQLAVVVWAISLHGALLFGAEIPPITGSALLVLFTAFSVFYVK